MLTGKEVKDSDGLLSLRAYGRRRGTSVEAVRRAIKSGRLKQSLGTDSRGQTKIADPDLADREWSANTDLSKAPGYVKERSAVTGVTDAVTGQEAVTTESGPASAGQLSLSEASAEEKRWKAKRAELDYRAEAGELIARDAVETWKAEVMAKFQEAISRGKTKLLGLPGLVKSAIPHLTTAEVMVIDGLIREALEDLAGPDQAAEQRSAA